MQKSYAAPSRLHRYGLSSEAQLIGFKKISDRYAARELSYSTVQKTTVLAAVQWKSPDDQQELELAYAANVVQIEAVCASVRNIKLQHLIRLLLTKIFLLAVGCC